MRQRLSPRLVVALVLMIFILSGAFDGRSPSARAAPAPAPVSGTAARLAGAAPALAEVPHAGGRPRPGENPQQADGDKAVFWAWDFHRQEYYSVPAIRQHTGALAWVYVEEGHALSDDTVKALGHLFEEAVYPKLREAYGPEPYPGIDGRRAISLLLLDVRDPLYYDAEPHTYYSGYFDPTNLRRQSDLDPEIPLYRSNEREMIYLDIAPTDADGRIVRQTMAHEFAHLIQWFHDESDADWLVEGLSELAVHLAGLGHPREHVLAFLADPSVSLVSWVGDVRDYGKVYLFMLYLYEQSQAGEEVGAPWLRQLVEHPADGMASLAAVWPLERPLPSALLDFSVAAHIDAPPEDGLQFGFRSLDMSDVPTPGEFPRPAVPVRPIEGFDGASLEIPPWSWRADVYELGSQAIDLEMTPEGPVCLAALRRGSSDSTPIEATCLAPGEPWARALPADDSGGAPPLTLIVANGTDLPNAIDVAVAPYLSPRTARAQSFLPLAITLR